MYNKGCIHGNGHIIVEGFDCISYILCFLLLNRVYARSEI